jgi:hypothetical protein
MKINGMKMLNYWTVTYMFNFIFYMATALLFMLFGNMVFQLQLFTDTSNFFMLVVLIGWGLSQVSVAILLSVFLSKS